MKKQSLVLGLVLGGCLAAVACSSSDDSSSNSNGGSGGVAGGSAGAGGGTSGAHAGGSGGTAKGGGSSEAGASQGGSAGASEAGAAGAPVVSEAGAGGEAGGGGFVFPPALDPWTVLVPSAAAAAPNHLLVAGTDFATSTEVASITLTPAAVGDSTTYTDGDAIPVSSAGLGFVIEATNDKVHLLDGGKVKTTFDVTDPGTDTAALTDNKAYVPLYNKSLIAILDLAAGKVSRRVDLSQFDDPSDSDGSSEISAAAYDPNKHIAYFLLGRVDRNAIAADPDYHLPCSTTRGLIVGLDTTTDAIVDLNGAADGKALPLTLVAPSSLELNAAGTTLTVLATGCYDGATLKHHGVEVITLMTGASTVAYTATGNDFLDALILTNGANALLHTFDDTFAGHWFKLNLASGMLGAELANVPDAVSYDGTDLLGVQISGKVGKVVRYSIAGETSTQVTATSWTGQYSMTSGSALVK